jgi:hypothetical protein
VRGFLEILVKQTVERHPHCIPLFDELYGRHIREQTQPSEKELLGLLQQLASTMATFYFLDALDEAPTAIQIDIMEKLTSLNIKLFITSRPLQTVEAAFPDAHLFRIAAQDQDIDTYLDRELPRTGDLRAILRTAGTTLQDEIKSSIKSASGGM